MTRTTEERAAVRIERTIQAAPHRVYRAWLDPGLVKRWMTPGPFEATRVEIDERVGGHYRMWHGEAGTDTGGFDSELVELVPGQRIVWRWGFVGPQRRQGPVYDSLLTIMLHDTGDGSTRLSLVHERLDALAAALPYVADNVGPGWQDVLGKLDAIASGPEA
jgi:uncharacterized protein YndB with AHSA1/START domain